MALIDAHRPPERNAFALVNGAGKQFDRFRRKASFRGDALERERLHEVGEGLEAAGVCRDVVAIDPIAFDQQPRQAVEQRQIGFRISRQMLRRGHRRFGRARIDDDDLGLMRIAHHPLPENRMRDAQIAADEHDHVGLFEVGIGVGRGVEAERLLCTPTTAVAMHCRVLPSPCSMPMPNLASAAEQRHFFGDDLSGAKKRDRMRAVRVLESLSSGRRTFAMQCPNRPVRIGPLDFATGVSSRGPAIEARQALPNPLGKPCPDSLDIRPMVLSRSPWPLRR